MLRTHYLIPLLSIAAIGCSGSATSPVSSSNPGVVGTWNWIHSEGGIWYHYYTPDSAHYTQTYVFNGDSTFVFRRTPDTKPAGSWQGHYTVFTGFYPIEHDTALQLSLWDPLKAVKPEVAGLLQFQTTDTMLIGDMATDGIQETYVRVH